MIRRGKGKYKADYATKDMYKFYKKNRTSNTPISKAMYTEILKAFNRELSKLVLYKTYEFRFPYNLGHLRIKKKDPSFKKDSEGNLVTNMSIDWKSTNELWERDEKAKKRKKLVYLLNEHTDGYIYTWYWDKAVCNIPNHRSYKFIPTRENKRWLKQILQDEELNIDYFK